MPDDAADSHPPKLKLKSACQSPDVEAPAASEPEPTEPATPPRESVIKLRRPIEDGDLTKPEAEKIAEPSEKPAAPTFDPENPFKKKQEEPPVDAPAPLNVTLKSPAANPEPTAAAVSAPRPAETPARSVPDSPQISQVSAPDESLSEPSSHNNSIGSSLLMIAALILVLGGGGYAIWMVLTEGPAGMSYATPAAESQSATQAQADSTDKPLNPIEKAKAALAKIPFLQTEEVINAGASSVDTEKTEAIQTDLAPVQNNAAVDAAVSTTAATTSGENGKQTAATFLANAHIDGVRSGSNPRVMLNGDNFIIGDIIDSTTGLKFIGIQDQKLLFRDRNGIVYGKSF